MPGDPHDLPTLPPTSSPTSGHLDAPEPAALLFSASGASSGRPGLFSHFRSHSKHHLLGGVGRDPAPAPTPQAIRPPCGPACLEAPTCLLEGAVSPARTQSPALVLVLTPPHRAGQASGTWGH